MNENPNTDGEKKLDAQENSAQANNSSATENNHEKQNDHAAEIQRLNEQVKEKENKYIYLYAEFENFKKRAVKERSELVKFGWESVARDLLTVIDNFDRALKHLPENLDKNLSAGLKMIHDHFRSTLERQGVSKQVTVGQAFDPNFHEAISQEPSEKPEGTILREEIAGYNLHGRLLRPARVVVSSGASKSTPETPAGNA